MEKNNLVVIVAGLGVVTAVAAGILSYNAGKQGGMSAMHMEMMGANKGDASATNATMDHSVMTMVEMTAELKGKTGDAFDRSFIEMMIAHHEGAVDMANLIPANAKHEELKKLGRDIVAAQTAEIAQMKQWLKDWGYAGAGQKTDKEIMDEMMPWMKH